MVEPLLGGCFGPSRRVFEGMRGVVTDRAEERGGEPVENRVSR